MINRVAERNFWTMFRAQNMSTEEKKRNKLTPSKTKRFFASFKL